jgi:peroxiredoxin
VLLGITGDSPFSHAEFHKHHQFPFPLLSDMHRKVIREYDLLDEERNGATVPPLVSTVTAASAGRRPATGR